MRLNHKECGNDGAFAFVVGAHVLVFVIVAAAAFFDSAMRQVILLENLWNLTNSHGMPSLMLPKVRDIT